LFCLYLYFVWTTYEGFLDLFENGSANRLFARLFRWVPLKWAPSACLTAVTVPSAKTTVECLFAFNTYPTKTIRPTQVHLISPRLYPAARGGTLRQVSDGICPQTDESFLNPHNCTNCPGSPTILVFFPQDLPLCLVV